MIRDFHRVRDIYHIEHTCVRNRISIYVKSKRTYLRSIFNGLDKNYLTKTLITRIETNIFRVIYIEYLIINSIVPDDVEDDILIVSLVLLQLDPIDPKIFAFDLLDCLY